MIKQFASILEGMQSGDIIPYIGANALIGCVNKETGEPIPADNESLILAMNNGEPMAKVLMYSFSRAAMNRELAKGRKFVPGFLTELYGSDVWSSTRLHDWIAQLKPQYMIDVNRDTLLQRNYEGMPYTLIVGIARMKEADYRFKIYHYDGTSYKEIEPEAVDQSLPILFKPMGTPMPEPSYIATDADQVDYLTELSAGFAIPTFIKERRKGKQYFFMGLPLTRDTERMIMSQMSYDAKEPRGWALIPEPTKKETRYCARMGIEIIETDVDTFLSEIEKLNVTEAETV